MERSDENADKEEKAPVLSPMISKPALQKAEMEWNRETKTPFLPNALQNEGITRRVPKNSMMKATLNMKPVILTTPPIWWAERLS